MNTTDQKLRMLEPEEGTLEGYKEIEIGSLTNLKKVLFGEDTKKKEDIEIAKLAHKLLQTVNRLRTNLRNDISLHIKLFTGISDNKKELKAYIRATYPKMIKK